MTVKAALSKIIPLARAIQDYWDAELPKRHPKYPLVDPPDAGDGPPPPETEQLQLFLEQLPEETLYKLAMVMDYWRNRSLDLEESYRDIRGEYDAPFLIARMLDNYHLYEELEYGLEILSEKHIDLDQFDFISAGA